jgi:hypothetical protein
MTKDAPRMRGYRSRNEDGELRQKRGDTHVGTKDIPGISQRIKICALPS